MLIKDTDLSTMTKNSLLRGGYLSMDDVCLERNWELLRLPQFGRKSLNEVEAWAHRNGKVAGYERLQLELAVATLQKRMEFMQRDLEAAQARLSA